MSLPVPGLWLCRGRVPACAVAVPWLCRAVGGTGMGAGSPGCPGQEWDTRPGAARRGGRAFQLPSAAGSGLARAGDGCGSVLPSPCAGRRGEDRAAVVASCWAFLSLSPWRVTCWSHWGFLGMCNGTEKPGPFESLVRLLPIPPHGKTEEALGQLPPTPHRVLLSRLTLAFPPGSQEPVEGSSGPIPGISAWAGHHPVSRAHLS